MRRVLTVTALTVTVFALSGGTASATECVDFGPDLSKFGIERLQWCQPWPLDPDVD